MELNINSPSYYTDEYGVEDEIYWMCRELSAYVREKEYSDVIHIVGILPIIAPKSVIDKGLCKTQKKCEPRAGFASICLQVDYEEYVKADISTKKKLMIDNILASVKSVSKRGKINYSLFEEDVLKFCENKNIIL